MIKLTNTSVTRYAATQVLISGILCAANKGIKEESLLKPYLELMNDSNEGIRKSILSSLKLLIPNIKPCEVEQIFFSDVSYFLKWIFSLLIVQNI